MEQRYRCGWSCRRYGISRYCILLHIFELAFKSHIFRKKVYQEMENWEIKQKDLPEDINQFAWRSFLQEYRDYLDIAKMAQMIPIIGVPVAVIVNNRLVKKLGNSAMQAYRMRLFDAAKSINKLPPDSL